MKHLLAIDKSYYLNKCEILRQKTAVTSIKAESLKEFLDASREKVLEIQGNVAIIRINGELSNERDYIAELFGFSQVIYKDIIESLAIAEENPSVEEIQMHISSPGGAVSGLMETMNAMNTTKKPINTYFSFCCSAAYFLASQSDKIIGLNKLSTVGSVGVIASFWDDSELMSKMGVKEVVITSSDAPNKYADVSTEKGVALIRERLDSIHNVLVEEVAKSRGVNKEYVNSNFGKGGVLLAEKAMDVKMIDKLIITTKNTKSVGNSQQIKGESENKNAISGGEMEQNLKKEVNAMDMKELQAQFPALYTEAFESGVKSEKVRIEKLNSWAKANPETTEIVAQAISQGKSADDVMPELMAAIKTGCSSVNVAAAESPKDLAQAKSDAHKQEEQPKAEKKEIDDAEILAIAKSAAASVGF